MKCTAIVLAGSRGGEDALCVATGAPHKAMIPIGGTPMLVRVVETLLGCDAVTEILISIADPALAFGLAPVVEAAALGKIRVLRSAGSPSASVLAAMAEVQNPRPLLLTAADHPLLRRDMVEYLISHADPKADAVAAVVAQDTIEAAYPETQRTYMRFRGFSFSGANLFLLRGPAAAGVVAFWRHVEANRKSPLRLLSALGPMTVLRFLSGRLDLARALHQLGRKCGAELSVVALPYAEAAIDVDKPEDLALVTRIIQSTE